MNRYSRLPATLTLLLTFTLAACQPISSVPADDEAAQPPSQALPPGPARTSSFDASKYARVYVYTIEEIDNDGRSLLHISYPVTEQAAINARMEELSQQYIQEYREIAAAIEKDYQNYKKETGTEAATFVTHYRQSFDVSVANQRVIFFDLERSIYTGGTGISYVIGYIFDRASGGELAIPDLFVDETYLERLAELSRATLAERLRREELASDLDWVADGTAPTAENFDNILFREDGTFLVRFDKYQVAAGVEGVVEIALEVDAIADLLKPEMRELLGVETDKEGKVGDSVRLTANVNRGNSTLAARAVLTDRLSLARSFSAPNVRLTDKAATNAIWSGLNQADQTGAEAVDCNHLPCVALTFDDGPSVYTEGLLDILSRHQVKATFFILGKSARIQSETVSRIFADGHQIGNHTWDHPNLTKLSAELIQQQLHQTDDIITQIVGQPTAHLRPPYGAYNDLVLAVSGLPIIFWSVDPLDWRDRDADVVAARIIESPAGAIILAHDIHKTTVAAVPAIIEALRERGIHFVTVTQLFEPEQLVAGNVYVRQPDVPSE
ncbi:MAG: polysaccharide deacetylase family protein [Caldilineaceae bacterium]|nr:polysaccharide deacetylase family protein [Caldilineaceae bacterium]